MIDAGYLAKAVCSRPFKLPPTERQGSQWGVRNRATTTLSRFWRNDDVANPRNVRRTRRPQTGRSALAADRSRWDGLRNGRLLHE